MNKYSIIILDRDGVISKKAIAHTHISSPKDFIFLPKSKEAIALLSKKGYKIAVISNQRGIGKGIMTHEDLKKINEKMISEIESSGGKIDAVYYCTHNDEDHCDCRKPKPGMIFQSLKEFNMEPKQAVLLGDFFSDYEAAKNAGCDFIYIDSESDEREDHRKKFQEANVKPLTFPSLYDAALFLTK
jgi:histidinol-phosphate phosphatase family protein